MEMKINMFNVEQLVVYVMFGLIAGTLQDWFLLLLIPIYWVGRLHYLSELMRRGDVEVIFNE